MLSIDLASAILSKKVTESDLRPGSDGSDCERSDLQVFSEIEL